MKFTATIIAAILASAAAFAPKGSSVRRSTGLNNFAPTKWSPKGGAARAPAPSGFAPAPQAVSYEPAPVAAAPAPVASSGPKNYKMTKWTPAGGAQPYGAPGSFTPAAVNGMAASESVAPVAAAPVTSSPAAPGPKNYKMTKWTPTGGSVPYGATGSFTSAAAEPAASSYGSGPVAASSAPAAPVKKNYSMTKWTPKGGAVPYGAPGSFTPAAPAEVSGMAESSYVAPAAPVVPSAPKSYSMTKWTPKGGSKPYTAPGSFTPASVNGMAASETAPVAPVPVAAAPAYASSAPKKNWSMTKWSPR